MKAQFPCPSNSFPPNDWVEESWTVDCICGVNFDDGEEMVNCDECGVWVHTRCSQYVKGESSFVCEKCNRENMNDSEEKEVAQLLAELPTKAMVVDNLYSSKNFYSQSFRLCNNVPKEERAHVQGIPGGEPGFFSGRSSIFTRELWKSTGYVPKKFTFPYHEFPFWNEKPEPCGTGNTLDENNAISSGTGMLCSLSMDNMMNMSGGGKKICGTAEWPDSMRLSSNKMNEMEDELDFDLMQHSETVRQGCNPMNKRKKEDSEMSEDCYEKKAKILGNEIDVQNGASRNTGTELPELDHCKMQLQLEVCQDGDSISPKSGTQPGKDQNLEGNDTQILAFDDLFGAGINILGSKSNLEDKKHLKNGNYIDDREKEGKVDHPSSTQIGCSGCIPDVTLPLERNGIIGSLGSEEEVDMVVHVFCNKDQQHGAAGTSFSPETKGRDSFESTNSVFCIPSATKIEIGLDLDNREYNKDFSQHFQTLKSGDEQFEDIEVSSAINSSPLHSEFKNMGVEGGLATISEFKSAGEGCIANTGQDVRVPIEERVSEPKSPSSSSYEDMNRDGPGSPGKLRLVSEFCADVEKVVDREMPVAMRKQVQKGGNYYSISYVRTGSSSKVSNNSSHKKKVASEDKTAPFLSQKSSETVKTSSLTSNALVALTDGEIALLLHQELNSSLRVPRVPRLRHAGSSPHLASPNTISMPKCATTSGRKDHRALKRSKDTLDVDSSKVGAEAESKISYSLGPRKKAREVLRDMNQASWPPLSETTNRDTAARELKISSGHQTLHGLISEIMSKGNRMSFEQLCDAVLPQWKTLLKHDEELYSYSSHSHAVLDCLRNRSEWLELVGSPKTNPSKRDRGVKLEQPNITAGVFKDCGMMDAEMNLGSLQEEFPKGKRKKRQRKLPSFQECFENGGKEQWPVAQFDDGIGSSSSTEKDDISSEHDDKNSY